MIKYIAASICLSGLIGGACSSERAVLSVEIAVPIRSEERVIDAGAGHHFHVLIKNHSKKPQPVWDEKYSFGWSALSFQLTDPSGRGWVVRKRDRGWTMNAPEFCTLSPKETLVLNIYPADTSTWEGFPLPERYPTNVSMRAQFEITADKYSRKYGIWKGRAISRLGSFVFHPASPISAVGEPEKAETLNE